MGKPWGYGVPLGSHAVAPQSSLRQTKLQAVLSGTSGRTTNHQPRQRQYTASPSAIVTMAAESKGVVSDATARNSRTLLRVVILCFIASAAIASRLFSVIRKPRLGRWLLHQPPDALAGLFG